MQGWRAQCPPIEKRAKLIRMLRVFVNSFSGFRREYLQFVYLRRSSEQFFGLGEQRFRNVSVQVSIPAFFICKRVEDAVFRRCYLPRVPGGGTRLPLCQGLRRLQKILDLFLFTRLR